MLDADGLVVALFSGAEKADELSFGVVTVASVVLSSAVLASVGLASAVLVVTSGAVLLVLVLMSRDVLLVPASLTVVDATTEAAEEESVPAESMGNCSV